MQIDDGAIVEFLRAVHPGEIWPLVAIIPDADRSYGATFDDGRVDEMLTWAAKANDRGHNLYYHANRVVGPIDKKAARTDIARMPHLHVDADPRRQDADDPRPAAEHLAEELDRIRARLTTNLPPGIPPPTFLVGSGGGCNALWRLDQSIVIDGQIEACEHYKRYNVTLERAFGGDDCHNLDRILRLPGTVNWPSKKKQARGRVPVMATIIKLGTESYPLSRFVAAPDVQAAREQARSSLGGSSSVPEVSVSGTVRRLGDVQRLAEICRSGATIPPDLAPVIALGHDPDKPDRFGGDRSRAVYYVCCELVRLGASDDSIYGVITDPALGISAHVLDKGSGAERTAVRQIRRAREHAVHPMLAALNESHAVIGSYGGRCVVVEEQPDWDESGRTRLVAQKRRDFEDRYCAQSVQVQTEGKNGRTVAKDVPVGTWWFNHPSRRYYDRVGFAPERDVPRMYNLWQGFTVDPLPGDAHLSYLEHVRDRICGGDPRLFDYVWSWLARCVQRPAEAGEVAIVLRAGQGTGKGTFVRWFGRLWGRHFMQITQNRHLTGNFNAHLADIVVLNADEAFYAGDPRNSDILKSLITEPTIAIERKFVDAEPARNFLHLIITSNHEWVVRLDLDDRRYVFLDVDESKVGDQPYWDRIDLDMRPVSEGGRGGMQHLLYALKTHDISGFNVRSIPTTDGRTDQQMRSMSTEDEWWFNKLWDGVLLPGFSWDEPVPRTLLIDDYLQLTQRTRTPRPSMPSVLGKFLKKACPRGWPTEQRVRMSMDGPHPAASSTIVPCWSFPSVDDCRAAWDGARGRGQPTAWPDLRVEPIASRRSMPI